MWLEYVVKVVINRHNNRVYGMLSSGRNNAMKLLQTNYTGMLTAR